MRFLSALIKVIEGLAIFAIVFWFMKWYIKGHFGKHALFFWIWSISVLVMAIHDNNRRNREQMEYEKMGTGAEIWKERMKTYDVERGY